MKISKTLYVPNREEWRKWLEKNHEAEREIWLIYYKKHTGEPRVSYDDAVEEALCFGWIDSIVKRMDDEKYAQKFTPRKNNQNWSELNVKRLRKLIAEGKMSAAGMKSLNSEILTDGYKPPQNNKNPEVPDFLKDALKKNPVARDNFNNLAQSYRRLYILWLSNAKTEATRQKRLEEALSLLEKNEKLGMR